MIQLLADAIASAAGECTMFAAMGLLIGGVDDVAMDAIWLVRGTWRRAVVYRRHPRVSAETLAPAAAPGRMAIFVPAWREADVIGAMLRTALARIEHDDYRLYVGTYPNDPATIAAVRAVRDPRVRLVTGDLPGPTTKAECLNRIWDALCRDERIERVRVKAVVLHDAEDVVHRHELKLFDRLIERFDLVQLPVLPLIDRGSPWVSGHYADEFAEAHGRLLPVREALGAGIPSAGVGTALGRRLLRAIADEAGGRPFDETSLTEDYEIGLRMRALGARGAFVTMPATPGGPPVAVRAYFPATMDAAVRQKTRWITGIAFAGWDRLRWRGGVAECWMRLRDRRIVAAALVVVASYVALLLGLLCWAMDLPVVLPGWMRPVLAANLVVLGWRVVLRAATVARFYGWRQGLLSIPRIPVANAIMIVAAWRAARAYVPGVTPIWDKTVHRFPAQVPCD